ncbi:MAG: SDR family NAD(P)-dependent oxidoreductase [Alphaproteobacteria bacterium]|nr:SDR family NAD(P)-dependent oxidoreductase [Alphaproteobacteria bacterium]
MKYLITGGAGFIGSNLADSLLNDGHEIVVIDNFNDYYDIEIKETNVAAHMNNQHYKIYHADIEDMEALQKIFAENKFDAVVHLAARAGVRPSLERPLDYVNSNIFGTVNILECMKNNACKKLVIASSSSVYGNCKAEKFSEDLKVTEPISPYAATKSACEQLCYTWHHLYGINVVALRFFTVYGPRQRPDLAISKFCRLIDEGKPIQMYGDGTTKRDYTFIEDIVAGIKASIAYDKTGFEIINLGGGEPITLKRMIATIEESMGKKAEIEHLPMQPGDVEKTVCDYTKAQKLLNYKPNTSFAEGIAKYVAWKRKAQK